MDKSPEAFRTISEVAEALETPAHVLRFWETRFPQIRPVKRAGGRRYYRPSDMALLTGIKRLLHEEGLTIRGVQKILREQGIRYVSGQGQEASAEEEALGAAMAARLDEEPEVISPEAAGDATVSALQDALAHGIGQGGTPPLPDRLAEAAERAERQPAVDIRRPGSGEAPPLAATAAAEGGATVISFPFDPAPAPQDPPPDSTKDQDLTDPDPRQILFPGFGPEKDLIEAPETADDSLVAPEAEAPGDALRREEDLHVEEAPFAFDVPHEPDPDHLSAEVTRLPLAAIDTPPQDREIPAEPSHNAEEDALPAATIAARLRALPPGSLSWQAETAEALAGRIASLRDRLGRLRISE